ncbi:MAG: glycosyltransferase family 2 protein [Syntrophobacteraceae bacterium]
MDSCPFVSVVTPFYNTEPFLAECIESVLRQSYQNWEYILVNNCSADRSMEIAQKYALVESRIRVINNDRFLSQQQNYNHALRQISPVSKYCKIVQADDWIFPECIMQMVQLAEAHPTVGVVGSYWLLGTHPCGGGLPYPSTFMSGADLCRWQLLLHPDEYVLGTPTSLLIRSELIRNRDPFYNENSIYEDIEICYELLKNCDFGFVHQVLTFTRVNNESISSGIRHLSPYILIALLGLMKYGPKYLKTPEYNQRLEILTDRYYKVLANALVYGQDKSFWDYHNEGLRSAGHRLSRAKLTRYVLWELMDLLRHPKALIRRLVLSQTLG